MKYLLSKYNIYKEFDNYVVLYNLLMRSYCRIEKSEYINLKKSEYNFLSDDRINQLKKDGFIIDENYNELNLEKFIYNKIKYSNNILSVTDAITLDCNLNCVYCIQKNTRKSEEKKPQNVSTRVKIWKKLLEITQNKKIIVNFFGGEPSLYPYHILELIKKSKEENINIIGFSMVSNGLEINDKMIKALQQDIFKTIQITLDGKKELHNKRRVSNLYNDTWTRIVENIKKIIHHTNLKIVINTVIDNVNFKENFEYLVKELIYIFGIEKIHTRFIFNIGLLSKPDGACSYVHGKIPSLKKYAQIYVDTVRIGIENKLKMTDFINVWPCLYNRESDFVISPNGDIYNCISGIGINDFKISNYKILLNNPEIFYQKYSQLIEQKNTDDICGSCKYLPICKGGCKYNSYVNKKIKDCWKSFHEYSFSKLIELKEMQKEMQEEIYD